MTPVVFTFAEMESSTHHSLILYGVEGTRGVDQTPTNSQQLQTSEKDAKLEPEGMNNSNQSCDALGFC